MKYGYARASTYDQNPVLQLAALKKAGCQTVFKDEGIGSRERHRNSSGRSEPFFNILLGLFAVLALMVTLFAAPASRKFTGVITDSMCATGDHSGMRMGPTDAECTIACVSAHGASYVVYNGKEAWTLSDQTTPEKFAGKKVIVVGTQDMKTRTIKVESILLAK